MVSLGRLVGGRSNRRKSANARVTVHHLEGLLARQAAGSPGQIAVEKDVARADRRLLAALKGMAMLLRPRGPAVKLTQVNVGVAERVVVR